MSLHYLNCTATAWYSDFTVRSYVIPYPILSIYSSHHIFLEYFDNTLCVLELIFVFGM